MDKSIVIDDSSLETPIDLDASNTTSMNDSEFADISIEQLLENATAQITEARTKLNKAATRTNPLAQSVVVRATSEMQAAIDSVIEIPSTNDDDDDVIFVGDNSDNDIINLCSPDNGLRYRSIVQSSRSRTTDKGATTAQPVPQPIPQREVDDGPRGNTVMCAVCMESSVGRHPHSTNCGHIFCGDCIKESIKRTKKCPLCNKALNQKSIFPVYL